MSNNNDNNNQANLNQQIDDDELNNANIHASPRGSREGTPNDMFEHDDGGAETRDELLKKIIDLRINKALRALVDQLTIAPATPNNNTLENPRSGLVDFGNGTVPSDSQDGEPGNSHLQNLVLTLQKQLNEQNKRIEQIPGVPPRTCFKF